MNFKKLTRRWNAKTRLMLTLELAVILPVGILIGLSVHHLKHIERDKAVAAAIQRDFSQVLAISEKQINEKAYDLIDDVRKQFPKPSMACTGTLDKILTSHPYAAHVFIYDPETGWIFRSQPSRVEDADFRKESEKLLEMEKGWVPVYYEELAGELRKKEKHSGIPYMFDANWPNRGDKHLYQAVAIFLIQGKSTEKPAIAGMAFDAEYLRDHFLPEAMDSVMSRNVAESQGDVNHAAMMLRSKMDSSPMVASAEWDGGEPEVERNWEGAFPGLILAIKMHGTTLQAISDHFFRQSFLILGGLSLLLAAGLGITYRNVSKEIALARLKSDFVSNVSHELRTPLSLIRLYAETLEMGRLKSPDKFQEYYQIIRKESERLTALINNILDFSRIEAGRKEYDFRETDLHELVKNTLESYRYQIEQHGFTLEEKIDPVPPMKVDREAMARSLVNLVNNALKYSQDHKYIGVNLYRENGSVKLEVIDHGIGIPSREQEKIFEKFYRVGDPLVHNTKGSGLGLSLVRHIAHAHGG
ncbi:MAG TPA: HAMP domain-containing sensor histidine kinase, partial [Terriglobales bacterium]|nr:HAMP domain-containing sensor histidine kinase [Terriglobales bacterium]